MNPCIRLNGIAPAWPVLLGTSHPFCSPGVFFTTNSASYSICSDMLCPLLRKKDFGRIANAFILVFDTNNRFPDPPFRSYKLYPVY
jgi:hypothetical protein